MADTIQPPEQDWQALVDRLASLPQPTDPAPAAPVDIPDFAIEDIPEGEYAPGGPYKSPKSDFVAGLRIVDVYNKYSAKGPVPKRQRGTNIVVRCPTPTHRDETPSACLETEKNVWVCYGCDASGGTYEIAAYHYGYDVPEYRYGSTFREVVDHMAEDFGWVEGEDSATEVIVVKDTDLPDPDPHFDDEAAEQLAPVLSIVEGGAAEEEPGKFIEIEDVDIMDRYEPFPWWQVYHEDGFRYAFMMETAVGRIFPHEFFAAGADIALGMALGHDVFLQTTVRTYANIYAALIGHTGSGKSVSTIPLRAILEEILPFNPAMTDGVKFLPQVASGEALIAQMKQEGINDDGQPDLLPMKGFLYVDELASFVGRMNRKGSILQPTLIEMYSSVDSRMATYSQHGGEFVCKNPFLSFITGVQPGAMQNLMGDTELVNGFLNRFIVYMGSNPEVPEKYDDTKPNPFVLESSTVLLSEIHEWAKKHSGKPLEWSDAARIQYMAVFHETFQKIDLSREPELARLKMIFLKLILLTAADLRHDKITVEHVYQAEQHLEYIAQGLGYAAANIGLTVVDECVQRITKGMKKRRGKWMKHKEVRELVRKGRFVDVFDKAIMLMIDLDIIEKKKMVSESGRGRPTYVYRLKEIA